MDHAVLDRPAPTQPFPGPNLSPVAPDIPSPRTAPEAQPAEPPLYDSLQPRTDNPALNQGEHLNHMRPDILVVAARHIGRSVVRLSQRVSAYSRQLGSAPTAPPQNITHAPEIADYLPMPGNAASGLSVQGLRKRYAQEHPDWRPLPLQPGAHRAAPTESKR